MSSVTSSRPNALSLSDLPDEILKLVMQHVSLKQRLSSCCFVSKRLHAAAVAATQHVKLVAPARPELRTSGMQWMSHYGQHVTELAISNFSQPLVQLHCPNLQSLWIDAGCDVQLGATVDGQPGVLPGCTKLTSLTLQCNIVDTPNSAVLDKLSTLLHLKSLFVKPMHSTRLGGLSGATLPRLQHLTSLGIYCLSGENLLQLGSLTSLQQLHFWAGDESSAAVGPSSVPGLTFPASLVALKLSSPVEAGILSLGPTGLQDLAIDCAVEGPAEGPGSFLSFMARLQHLTALELNLHNVQAWPPVGPAYSAITASSKLVDLGLSINCPGGFCEHVFPGTHRLPHLAWLRLGCGPCEQDGAAHLPFDAADLTRLVECCPNLRSIDDVFVQPGVHVSELRKLTALRYLYVTYELPDSNSFDASVKGLLALTQLKCLRVEQNKNPMCLKLASLLPLTSLTALTELCVEHHDHDEGANSTDVYGRGWRLTLRMAQDGSGDSVWLQLLEHCAHRTAHKLTEQTVLTAHQEQRLLAQEQVIAAQGQHIAAQEQIIAAQDQEIAALQYRMQELQAQVQQLLPALPQPSHPPGQQ